MASADLIFPRHMQAEIVNALQASSVVNLVGPTQVGKTTLVRDLLGVGEFLTLDDEAILRAIEADAFGLLEDARRRAGDAPLIIDEAQRSRSLAPAIERIVDRNSRKGQFLLAGSSDVFSEAEVADSLADRVITLALRPLTVAEMKERKPSLILDWATQQCPRLDDLPQAEWAARDDYIGLVLAGGYPEIHGWPTRRRQQRIHSFFDTVIRRDAAHILRIRKPDAMRLLIAQVAARTGSELNLASLARILGIHRPTVEQYLDVLIKLSLALRLEHWKPDEGSRGLKNPKYHFVDTGLAAALGRFNPESFSSTANPAALDGLLETFVFNELLRSLPFQEMDGRLFHWRSRDGRKIDMIFDAGAHLVCIDIKASSMVKADDFKHIEWFAKEGPGRTRTTTGLVFNLRHAALSFGDRFFALPVSTLWTNEDG